MPLCGFGQPNKTRHSDKEDQIQIWFKTSLNKTPAKGSLSSADNQRNEMSRDGVGEAPRKSGNQKSNFSPSVQEVDGQPDTDDVKNIAYIHQNILELNRGE